MKTYRASSQGIQKIKAAMKQKGYKVADDSEIFISASIWIINTYQQSKHYQDTDNAWIENFSELFSLDNRNKNEYKNDYEKLKNELVNSNGKSYPELIKNFIEFESKSDFYITGISFGTWNSFTRRKPINERAFQAYCAILEIRLVRNY
jgi:hypothetical protein